MRAREPRNKINLTSLYLIDELDRTLAIVGAIFSLILTILIKLVIGHPISIMVGIFCFLVCIGYLIIRRFFHPLLIPSLEELRCSNRFYITLNILFFVLFSYSIISIYLRPDPYIRPLGYFISTMLMTVIVANEILFISHKKQHIYLIISKVIIIGLSLQFSQILIFPSVVGVDTWAHQWITLEILDNGNIPEGFMYSKLPMMHLMIGITSLVTNLGYKMATMISISFLQVVCDALFVFLLGKFLISNRVGLLSALLLEVGTQHIRFGYDTAPTTMAATLILPITFILLKMRKDKPFIGTSVALFLMGTLILTHTVTSMCLAIFLFIFWLSSEAYNRLFHQETGHSVTWTICFLFSTGMFAYWSYISGHILTLARFIKIGFYEPSFELKYHALSYIPFWEQIFEYLGMFLFFSLSFIGFFYILSKQFRNSHRVSTTIGGIVILCLAFFSFITERDIIVGRWLYFSQILMAVPLSLSLLLLIGIFKQKFIKCLLMSLSVLFLSFLLIMSSTANIDNRLFSPNSGARLAFTESELKAMNTILEIWNGTIGCDGYSILPYKFQLNREFARIDDLLYAGDFTDLQFVLFLVREEIVHHPYPTYKGSIRLKYDLNVALDNQTFSRIYDCGSASGYLKP